MYKMITLFKNINDLETFRKQFFEQLLPLINNVPGSICTDITALSSVSEQMSGELGEIQYMVETHFESEEIMNEVLTKPEVAHYMMRVFEETPSESSFFTGNTARIYSDAAKHKFKEVNQKSFVSDLDEKRKNEKYIETSHDS